MTAYDCGLRGIARRRSVSTYRRIISYVASTKTLSSKSVGRIYTLLDAFVAKLQLGEAFLSPIDVYFDKQRSISA